MTANVVLWPKVFVLSLSKKRFDSLTSQQQGWVREAAAQAVKASADASYDDSTIAQSLCTTGVRFYDASAAQIAALRSKVRPVLDKLAMTTFDAALLRAIQAIARRHPTPEPLNVPADCRQGVSAPNKLAALRWSAVHWRRRGCCPTASFRYQLRTRREYRRWPSFYACCTQP